MAEPKVNKFKPRERNRNKPQNYIKFDPSIKFPKKDKKWKLESDEIDKLRIAYKSVDPSKLENFTDFPLSGKTKKGLADAKYSIPTNIQKASILLALHKNDILGAAKTGSGKTLAFLIPILECLFCDRINANDGLVGLVVTPTRELAYQIFEVLRKIGKFHDFSAGLVIGGKKLKAEADQIARTNIVICTPGRILQHMDETPGFSAINLQILVLDEADRILDMGFQRTMNAIIENLPQKRQTLLFSATQTRSVKDLARLSLKDPMYVSVHENSECSTPSQLQQHYMVRFIYECFRRLKPGMTVLCLHGAMKQLKRVEVYESYSRKEFAVLFATDIAARGLDFPAVNWVVQMDCPEDTDTYIHRVGRTARYKNEGETLLVLTPSEIEMVNLLKMKKIPVEEIKVNPSRLWSIQPKLESMLASDITLKEFGQRGFVSYIKAVFLMKNKEVFDVKKFDLDKYSSSFGLAIAPRVRFLKKKVRNEEKGLAEANKDEAAVEALFSRMDAAHVFDDIKNDSKLSKGEQILKDNLREIASDSDSNNEDAGSDSEESHDSEESEEEDDDSKLLTLKSKKDDDINFDVGDADLDDLLFVKKVIFDDDVEDSSSSNEDDPIQEKEDKKIKKVQSKYKSAKILQKKKINVNTKVVYDEEGEEIVDKYKKSIIEDEEVDENVGGISIEEAKRRMQEEDIVDKEIHRERVKAMHKEAKRKEKKKRTRKTSDDESMEDEAVLPSDDEHVSNPLDFIPDPDEIYGPKEDSDDTSSVESDDCSSPPKKKKTLNTCIKDPITKQQFAEDSYSDEYQTESDEESNKPMMDNHENDFESVNESATDEENSDTDHDIEDAEAMALRLLS